MTEPSNESPLQFATRIGIAWNRALPGKMLSWDEVLDLAVDAYWDRAGASA
jgi:hypothetical protein